MPSFSNDDLIAEGDTQGARLAADLTDLFAAPVPSLSFQRPAERDRHERAGWLGIRTVAIAAGLVAIVVAATLLAVRPWSGAAEISAAEIVARAASVAAGRIETVDTEPYHTIYHAGFPDADGKQTFRTEIWYGGPDRYRIEVSSRPNEPNSPSDYFHGRIVNGDDAWIYHQQSVCPGEIVNPPNCDGVLRAVHLPASELEGSPLDFSGQPTTLPDLLSSYNADTCGSATLLGDKVILLGRRVYVILITPLPGCRLYDEEPVDFPELRDAEGNIVFPGPRDTRVTKVTVWVDTETFLTLQTRYERDGWSVVNPAGYEQDPELPESTFIYEPPEGVTVQEVANYQEALEAIGPRAR